jgi:hypothetical protein
VIGGPINKPPLIPENPLGENTVAPLQNRAESASKNAQFFFRIIQLQNGETNLITEAGHRRYLTD